MFEKRLFIASPIDSIEVNSHIMLTRQNLRIKFPEINWRWENNTHITLRFLGDVNINNQITSDILSQIHYKLDKLLSQTEQFSFQLGQLNTFDNVLWYSIEGTKEKHRLNNVVNQINTIVQHHGYAPPDFIFIPHITVARFDNEHYDEINNYITTNKHHRQRNFTINSIILMESLKYLDKYIYQPAFKEFIWELQ